MGGGGESTAQAATMLNAGSVRVRVLRKPIKNMYLRVKSAEGPVDVTAPLRMSDADIAAFVTAKAAWIDACREALVSGPVGRGAPTEDELRAWRKALERDAPPLTAAWAEKMGVRPERLVYRNMTSRWGSCVPSTGRICLNVQLAAAPEGSLEYVIVHELAHLIESGHGPRFQAVMDAYLPDWRERRARLRGIIRRTAP